MATVERARKVSRVRRGVVGALALGASGALVATATITTSTPASAAALATYTASYGYRGHAGLYGYGMAYDAALGKVMVADLWNYRVQSFNPDGTGQSVFFSTIAARGASGGIGAPFGLATDSSGAVYVADQSNSRVVKIDSAGHWAMTIGYGGSPNLTPGCGGGHMTIPTHVIIDTNGDIYVSDPRCGDIYVFNSSGAYLRNFNLAKSIPHPIPRGIIIDKRGAVVVAEFNSKLLWAFDKSGNLLGKYAAPTPKPHDMSDERGIAYDAVNDRVYVVGAQNNTVPVFNAATRGYITTWSDASWNSIRFVTVDTSGNVYISDLYGYIVHKYSSSGPPASAWATGAEPPPNGGWNQLNGVAFDPNPGRITTGHLYGVDTFENRVQEFNTNTPGACPTKLSCPAFVQAFGHRAPLMPNTPNLDYPHQAAIDPNSPRLVMDGQNVLIVWDISKSPPAFVGNIGIHGTGLSQFKDGPQGIQVARYGTTASAIYTVDHGNCRIQIFDFTGNLLAHMGSCGSGTDQMQGPRSLTVDPTNGHVYVGDAGNNRVVEWDSSTGHIIATLSGVVAGSKLNQPWGVELSPSTIPGGSMVYIGDTLNKRIIRVNTSLSAASAAFVTNGADDPQGGLGGPQWMQFNGAQLYVSDNNQSIYDFTITG